MRFKGLQVLLISVTILEAAIFTYYLAAHLASAYFNFRGLSVWLHFLRDIRDAELSAIKPRGNVDAQPRVCVRPRRCSPELYRLNETIMPIETLKKDWSFSYRASLAEVSSSPLRQ